MKDLIKLYSIYSVGQTDGEREICDWICAKLDSLKVVYKRIGNTIYSFTKTNKVMLSAHLDQVDTNGKPAHFYQDSIGNIAAFNSKWQRTSLGADDKNGVWIILKLLEKGYKFDFIISECEECGGFGIAKVNPYIDESTASYCLVLDRKGNYDILNKGGATTYCQALAHNLKNFFNNGYFVTTGGMSDTQTICKYKESVNMSVAYFGPHTKDEYTDFNRLKEILNDVEKVVKGDFVHYASKPSDYTPTSVTTYPKHWWKDIYDA